MPKKNQPGCPCCSPCPNCDALEPSYDEWYDDPTPTIAIDDQLLFLGNLWLQVIASALPAVDTLFDDTGLKIKASTLEVRFNGYINIGESTDIPQKLWDRAHANCRVELGDYPACASWPSTVGSLSLRNPVSCTDYSGLNCHEDFTGVRGGEFRVPGGSGNVIVVAWRIAYVLENGCHAYSPIDWRAVYRPPCGDAVVTDDATYALASNGSASETPSYYYNNTVSTQAGALTWWEAFLDYFGNLDLVMEVGTTTTGALSDYDATLSLTYQNRVGTTFYYAYEETWDADPREADVWQVLADPHFTLGGSPAAWYQQRFGQAFSADFEVQTGAKSTASFKYNDPVVDGEVRFYITVQTRSDLSTACSGTPTFPDWSTVNVGSYGSSYCEVDGGTLDCPIGAVLTGITSGGAASNNLRTGQADPCAFGGYTEVASSLDVDSIEVTINA